MHNMPNWNWLPPIRSKSVENINGKYNILMWWIKLPKIQRMYEIFGIQIAFGITFNIHAINMPKWMQIISLLWALRRTSMWAKW